MCCDDSKPFETLSLCCIFSAHAQLLYKQVRLLGEYRDAHNVCSLEFLSDQLSIMFISGGSFFYN